MSKEKPLNEMKTEQKTVNEKIEIYFKEQVDYKSFAQQLRRATYIIADVMCKVDAEQNVTKSSWANDCFYHLNEFAEVLQPLLED